jgi:hypothetical protein
LGENTFFKKIFFLNFRNWNFLKKIFFFIFIVFQIFFLNVSTR